jgi:gliding motility-associated-like protein
VIVPAGQTASFTWWITNGYCDSSSASLKITNFQRPAVATVGKDQAHCNDSLFTLSGNTPTEYGAQGVWRYPATFRGVIRITDSTLANTTVMVPAGNTVPFTWWITNGLCDSTSATLKLTNYAVASKANAGANQQLCNNTGDFIMTANSPGVPTAIGTWTDISRVPGRAIIKSPNNPATAVTVPVGDTAVLQWAIANGVCDTTFSRVTIINYKEATTAYAGPDQEKCNTNADFIMNASQPGVPSATGTWTDVSRVPGLANIKDKNNPASAVTVPIGDTVILKWTVANGTCSSTSSTVTLINYKKADSAYAGPDISMCNNNGDFTMAAYPPSVPSAKGFWSIVKGNAVIKAINNPATAVNINVGDTVVLRWTVTNGVCSATWNDVTLINYQLPVAANAGTNQEHCNDSSFTMNASDPGVPGAKGTWIVTSNNASLIGISNINDRKAVITVPAGETAQLTWVVSNGVCNATSSSVTLINRKPILGNTIQRDQNVCITETPMAIRSNALSGGNGTYSYQWQQSTAGAGGPFTNIAGANTDMYQPGVLSANTWYRRIVTSGACIDNISNVVKITVITINPVVTFTPPAMTVECEKGKDYTTYFGTPVFSHLPYDNEPLTVTYSDVTVVTSPCLSTITRTWTATDRCNLSVTTSQTITIRDTKAPVFTSPAPADTTVDCDKVPAGVALKAMDDCAGEVIIPFVEVRQDLPGNCSNNYLLIRTWTSKDACNTGVTLRQVVTVKDMTAPVFNVPTPADTTVDCDKIPAGINLTATDNCTPGIITVIPKDSAVHNPGNCNSNYVIYRKWTAFDECGNSRAVQQVIQVQDTTRPVFSMPAPKDTVVDCDKVPAWPAITASDNCSGNIQVFTNSKTIRQSGNCANNYQEIRTWTATDECGNKSEMKQVITVQDTTRPVFTVRPPADTMVSCDNIPAPATNVQISDNCSTIGNGLVLSRRIYTESIPGACTSNYRIIRMWIAKDACGNADTVKQVLTVKDTTRPVIMPAPADVVLYCQDKIPAPPVLTATDNCDNSFPKNAIYTEDPYVADICNGYTIIRRWSITDACGNKADDVIQRVIINPCDKPKLEATLPSNCSDNGRIALRKVGKVYLPTYTLVAVTAANAVPGLPRSQNNNVFNLNGATSASFIITDGRTGCSSDTVTYQLSYIRKPAVHLGNDTTICGGNSLVLDAGPANFAYKIQWSTGETTQRIVVKQAGTYWVNVSNGECATTDSIHVALIPTPLVSIPDTTICRGQSVKLDAYVNGAQYLWSNGSTASSILVSTQEQFWVKVMKAGCITIDTVKVSVNPPPDISLSRDTAICPDQAVMLTVNSNGGRIRWQTGETGNSIVVNQPGAYWVAVSRDNCVVKDTVNVRLKPALKLDLGPDRNICPGATITLNGTNPDAISYLWNDGDPNPVKQVSQSGKYKLAVMDKYCQRVYTASVNVNTTGLPVINLGRDTTLCVGETLTLRAEGGGITSARWDDGTYGPTRTVSSAGTYTVTVSNDCGTANDDITVSVVQCEPKPVVPNAFSPNGDGRNDVFRPVVRGQMFDYQLRIFNRWGELIFLSEDAHKGWDGKYKGVPVEVGTYVWWLSYKKVPGGPINVLKGEVTVIR